ncbi:MAG: hypothetical protein ACR2PT_19955 [Endozoicomonas sp.]
MNIKTTMSGSGTMKRIEKLVLAAAVSLGLFGASLGMAATEGDIDNAESIGTIGVELNVAKYIQVSGLDDLTIDYNRTDTQPTLSASSAFCVATNAASYNLSAEGFSVLGTGGSVSYTVDVYDDNATTGTAAGTLDDDSDLIATLSNVQRDNLNCGANQDPSNQNAAIKVSFTETDIETIQTGGYTGVLTLKVAPN